MSLPTKTEVMEALKPVVDPDIGLSLVDLGLIYDVLIEESGRLSIRMTLTTPACPFAPQLLQSVNDAAEKIEGITDVEVILVWEPPWDPKTMASDHAKDALGIW
jgi:metal-sulfur cluster biosynthetic enzyme